MVDVVLTNNPGVEGIQNDIERVTSPDRDGHPVADREAVIDYNSEEGELVVDYDRLYRVLIEHQQYEEADQSPTRLNLLRIIESAPESVGRREIHIDQIREQMEERLGHGISDSSLHEHLRKLIDKGFIERLGERSGVYRYTGP